MPIPAIQRECTGPQNEAAQTSDGHQRPGVIITGSCADSAFVATTVLICADTLSAEEAIRAWLEAHGIRVAG